MMQLIVTQVIYLDRFGDIPAEFNRMAIFGRAGVRQWWATARDLYSAHVVTLIDARFAISALEQ